MVLALLPLPNYPQLGGPLSSIIVDKVFEYGKKWWKYINLKSYINFKHMWLPNKWSNQHEILHATIADQNLFTSFFRNWFEFLEVEICRFFMLQLTWNTLYNGKRNMPLMVGCHENTFPCILATISIYWEIWGKIKCATTFQQYVLQEYCSFGCCYWAYSCLTTLWCSLATAKWVTFL